MGSYMVDSIRAQLGEDMITISNVFFQTSDLAQLAGEGMWTHSKTTYVESLVGYG